MQNRSKNSLSLDDQEKSALLTLFPRGIVAFDLEMTGLSPLVDRIIEIAAIKLLPGGKVETFHQLINPMMEIPENSIQYHNITNEMVRDCPALKKPLKDFIKFYGNLPLVAHNAQFDVAHLVRGHHQINEKLGLSDVFDSCKLARILYKHDKNSERPENFKLSSLASYYEIEFGHHQALDDAIACAKVFARLLSKIYSQGKSNELRQMAFLFKLSSFKKPTDYLLPKKLEALKDALTQKAEVVINYRGSNNSGPRKVKPIALLPLPQGLVLYALCLGSDMNKHFLVSKIKSLGE